MTEGRAHAPTPFTAAEIREGCPSGREVTIRVDAAGGEAILHHPRRARLRTIRRLVEADGTQRLWFARSLPGLPVRTATVSGGIETVTSEVVKDSTDLFA